MLFPILRPTKIVTLSGATNNVDLYSSSGSPGYPLTVINIINSGVAIGSTSVCSPAFKTGTGWKGGTLLYIKNCGSVTGKVGTDGTVGGTGNQGNPGSAGLPGNVGNVDRKSTRLNSSH